jgi:uncharacterized membrane protein
MELYEVLLLFHILAAITWVGGAVSINILGARMQRGEAIALAEFARQTEWIGSRLFAPSTVLVLGLGIWMVAINDAWTIGQLWIILALVGIAITGITGAAFFGPESKRISEAIRARGPDDPDARRRIRRVIALGRLDVDMVIKPGL